MTVTTTTAAAASTYTSNTVITRELYYLWQRNSAQMHLSHSSSKQELVWLGGARMPHTVYTIRLFVKRCAVSAPTDESALACVYVMCVCYYSSFRVVNVTAIQLASLLHLIWSKYAFRKYFKRTSCYSIHFYAILSGITKIHITISAPGKWRKFYFAIFVNGVGHWKSYCRFGSWNLFHSEWKKKTNKSLGYDFQRMFFRSNHAKCKYLTGRKLKMPNRRI